MLVFISHGSSGINWVLSTTLLQERTEDEWRGRVAGTDYFLLTGMMGFSALGAGLFWNMMFSVFEKQSLLLH